MDGARANGHPPPLVLCVLALRTLNLSPVAQKGATNAPPASHDMATRSGRQAGGAGSPPLDKATPDGHQGLKNIRVCPQALSQAIAELTRPEELEAAGVLASLTALPLTDNLLRALGPKGRDVSVAEARCGVEANAWLPDDLRPGGRNDDANSADDKDDHPSTTSGLSCGDWGADVLTGEEEGPEGPEDFSEVRMWARGWERSREWAVRDVARGGGEGR